MSYTQPIHLRYIPIILILTILLFGLEAIYAQNSLLYPVTQNNKWGLINHKGQLVVPAKYEAIGEFKHFGYAIMQRNGGVGLLDSLGKELIRPMYSDLRVLDAQMISVIHNGQRKIIDINENVILDMSFQDFYKIDKDHYVYIHNKKLGIIHKSGKTLSTPKYDKIESITDQEWLITQKGKFGLIDKLSLQEKLEPIYDKIIALDHGLFLIKKQKHWGLFDDNQFNPVKYQNYYVLSNKLISFELEDSKHLYNIKLKKFVCTENYQNYYPIDDNLILAQKDSKVGLINYQGAKLLSPNYHEILPFDKQNYRVRLGHQWAIIDRFGKPILPYQYQFIGPLIEQIAVYRGSDKLGLLNAKGQIVSDAVYDHIQLSGNIAYAHKDQQNFLLQFDEQGNLLSNDALNTLLNISIHSKVNNKSQKEVFQTHFSLNSTYEWFYASETNKWGLRNQIDGIIKIEPRFDHVKIFHQLGFTLVSLNLDTKITYDRTTFRYRNRFGLVNNELGLLVKEIDLLDIKIEDFDIGYPAARCVFSDGSHGLMLPTGKVIATGFTFIGNPQDSIIRAAKGGQLSPNAAKTASSLMPFSHYLEKQLSSSQMLDYTQYDQKVLNQFELHCNDCSWGFVDPYGRPVSEFQYKYATNMTNKVSLVQCDDMWGMIDDSGNQILPCQFDSIQFLINTQNTMLRIFKKNRKYGLIDTLGQLCVQPKYDDIGEMTQDRLAVKSKNLWGFTNHKGQLIIPCRFHQVRPFQEDFAAIKLGNKWGFIDRNGKLLIDPKYTRVGQFSNGLAWAMLNGQVGFINKLGDWIIPPNFHLANDFNHGVAIVVKDFKYGIINTNGHYITKPRLKKIFPFDENGLAIYQYGMEKIKYGIISRTGQTIIEGLSEISPFSQGFAAIRTKEGFGYIDTQGKIVITPKYSKAGPFNQGLAPVYKDGLCGYIDPNGTWIVTCQYTRCQSFEDGLAVVYHGIKKGGLIDRQGNEILEPSINRLYQFSEGKGLVRKPQKGYIYISDQSRYYDGTYQDARAYNHGVAAIKVKGKWGIINQKGLEIISPKYDQIESFKNGYAKVRIPGFNGLTNLKGQLIAQPLYEAVSHAGQGIYRVENGNKIGYFNDTGKWIWRLDPINQNP